MTEPVSDLAAMRASYDEGRLIESELAATPHEQFVRWMAEAIGSGLAEPNAMVLATADALGAPSSRTVLLKSVDARGFAFFTNLQSRKGREIASNPRVSLTFPWFAMKRQIVVIGEVDQVSREEAAAYFASRPYGSKLGAWASAQSSVIASREVLKARYAELSAVFPETGRPDEVPLPDGWGGFLVRPSSVEFWQGRPSRLHDRLRFVRLDTPDGGPSELDDPQAWRVERLSS